MKTLLILFSLCLAYVAPGAANAQAASESPDEGVPARTLTEEELEDLEFETTKEEEEEPADIEELSVGQRYILDTQRREIKDLIARELGVMSLAGDASDLATFQRLFDRRILKQNQVREWQSVGILFGDILVNEYDFEWVSYEDDLGASKALQWRDTRNFVFPITVFSKRLQFGQDLDFGEVYDEVKADIESFIEYERNRVKS